MWEGAERSLAVVLSSSPQSRRHPDPCPKENPRSRHVASASERMCAHGTVGPERVTGTFAVAEATLHSRRTCEEMQSFAVLSAHSVSFLSATLLWGGTCIFKRGPCTAAEATNGPKHDQEGVGIELAHQARQREERAACSLQREEQAECDDWDALGACRTWSADVVWTGYPEGCGTLDSSKCFESKLPESSSRPRGDRARGVSRTTQSPFVDRLLGL